MCHGYSRVDGISDGTYDATVVYLACACAPRHNQLWNLETVLCNFDDVVEVAINVFVGWALPQSEGKSSLLAC